MFLRKSHSAVQDTYRAYNRTRMKGLILIFVTVFSIIGSYIPILLGDEGGLLSGWSILGGIIGGLFGIWLAVWVSKRYDI